MTITKNKWYGKCAICKKEANLSTSRTHTGLNMNYTIIRSCDKCSKKIHDLIEIILTALYRKETE